MTILDQSTLEQIERYVMQRLELELDPKYCYHNADHTRDVVKAALFYGRAEGLRAEELELLHLAALFHDLGYLLGPDNHEHASSQMSAEVLPGFGLGSNSIRRIQQMINATKFPADPKNVCERILCDADLDYLGTDRFFELSDLLQQELSNCGCAFGDQAWLRQVLDFVTNHRYFTDCAIIRREARKQEYIKELERRVRLGRAQINFE